MPGLRHLAALLCLAGSGLAAAGGDNPIQQTIQLLTKLQGTIVRDGEAEQVAYNEYYKWCDDASTERAHEVKMLTRQVGKLEAEIAVCVSDITDADRTIEELTKSISTTNTKLDMATELREAEASDFKASEEKLLNSIDLLDKAVRVLQKEEHKQKGWAIFMQTKAKRTEQVVRALAAVVAAAGLPSEGRQRLQSLLQLRRGSAGAGAGPDEEEDYSFRSGGIMETMEKLRDSAEESLRDTRKMEGKAKHNYELLKMELEEQIRAAEKEIGLQKITKSTRLRDKADEEGDLEVEQEALHNTQEALKHTKHTCMARAAEHERTVQTRAAELKALDEAKDTIAETMGGAEGQTYSFVQLRRSRRASLASRQRAERAARAAFLKRTALPQDKRIAAMIRNLAARHNSTELAQLASRIVAVARYGAAAGEDPFLKVKGLIKDMIVKLEREYKADEKHSTAMCTEMNKSSTKMDDLQDLGEGLKGKIDQAVAASAGIKGEIKDLQTELRDVQALQQDLDKARSEGREVFLTAKGDLEQGLMGARSATRILREYYSADEEEEDAALLQSEAGASDEGQEEQPDPPQVHKKSTGAGAGIIGLLEVISEDLSKNLAQMESDEDEAQQEYEAQTQENKVIAAEKEKDVEYKTREFKAIDKRVVELTSDFDAANEELAAVTEYFQKVKEKCLVKGENFQEKQERVASEIQSLEEALAILQSTAKNR